MEISSEVLDEAYPIIDRLAKSRSANGTFAYHDKDDISQEVWRICLEGLAKYEPSTGPVENFLVVHVTNRLKNFRRDTYFRPGSDAVGSGLALVRMNLVNALPLNGDEMLQKGTLMGVSSTPLDPADQIIRNEDVAHIVEQLPEEMVEPFKAMIGNNKVRSPLAIAVLDKVRDILSEEEQDG